MKIYFELVTSIISLIIMGTYRYHMVLIRATRIREREAANEMAPV